MTDTVTLEALGAEIRQSLDAVKSEQTERLSDESLTRMIKDSLKGFLETPDGAEYVRKIRFGPTDQKLVGSKFGRLGMTVSDVEMLNDVLVAGQRSGVSSGPSEELRNVIKAVSEGRYEDTAVIRSEGHRQLADSLKSGRMSPEGYERAVRAMDTAESGYGLQLVGAQYVHDLWKGAEAKSRVFGLFNSFEMTAPTAYLPVQATLPVVSYVGESTGALAFASPYGTTKTGSNRVQCDAKKLILHQVWSGEMEEDSLVAFIPFLRDEQQRSWAYHMDSLLLNGDTTVAGTGNINSDDAAPAATAFYVSMNGIRHSALVSNTANTENVGGALTLNHLRKQMGRMLDVTYKHDWSHPLNADDFVYIADPETADVISFFDECLTVDKIGDRATVLNGQIGRILNHPLIASMEVSKTPATGRTSSAAPATNTKGQLVAVNTRGGVVGNRRQLQTELERLPASDQTRIIQSTRLGFGRFTPSGVSSGIEWADCAFNITI